MTGSKKLDDSPFDFTESRNGVVQISYKGKVVTTLKGNDAAKFSAKASNCLGTDRQLLMAKATGQFKYGNEKSSKPWR